jgi:DEAD/DEAH box helicase domain-containing protein
MTPPTVVFDLETQRLAQEVGGWRHIDKLGLAAAVVFEPASGKVHRLREADAPFLVELLGAAGLVVGYNIERFDYEVLRPYGLEAEALRGGRTLDLLSRLYARLGFRLALDNVASATLGASKTADGLAAVRWYREGRIEEVLDYCEEDVRITARLWEHGRLHRQVMYRDRDLRLRQVPVSW